MIAIIVAFLAIGGAGFLTFNAATEYTGSSETVCQRDSDGNRTCSNPARSGAEIAIFFGISSDDAAVTSEPLLNTSRALFASLALLIAGSVYLAHSNSKRRTVT